MNGPARALFAACLFLVIFGLAAGNGAGLTRSAAFQAELDSLRHEYGFPGATAAYVLADGTGGEAATGFADRETATVMTPRSRLLSASIGKTYLAAATVALAGEGWLNLDLPVSFWLGDQPWFSRLPNHRQITLRHLLTHSSGLADHVYSERFIAEVAPRWREPDNPFPPLALIEYSLDTLPLFAAGRGWAYSDSGYILAGLAIEAATGRDCFREITERFLAPLGL
ncbi:MAG TPA: serine hydrolase domain-containing protein, partial [Desulforhopalus sp.]|nr:serine hydrolase domain-containing protein [Desulforhopalus sp.]